MALADFEGAEDIRNAWLAGLAPDPALTVSQWADRHRILSSRAASEAGPYRTARTPFMRAIMDALSPASPARRVVFQKGACGHELRACPTVVELSHSVIKIAAPPQPGRRWRISSSQ